jgi:hypothetical protein
MTDQESPALSTAASRGCLLADAGERPAWPGRGWRAVIGAGLAAVVLAGCGGEDLKPAQALDAVAAPDWFTEPADTAEPEADPPRWTRVYAKLPRSRSDVELAYSQALDRAGWRFRGGSCPQAPTGGEIDADCWLNGGLVLAFATSAEGSGVAEKGPTRLDVVLHAAADSAR